MEMVAIYTTGKEAAYDYCTIVDPALYYVDSLKNLKKLWLILIPAESAAYQIARFDSGWYTRTPEQLAEEIKWGYVKPA